MNFIRNVQGSEPSTKTMNNDLIIQQTKNWINSVVIGCNFCPFAAKEMRQNTIRYSIEASDDLLLCLETFLKECKLLDNDSTIETTLLILPNATPAFDDYLQLVDLAEKLITEQDYEGVYQVASFHPQYLFAGSTEKDASNYTNRSIYPMLHLLREESIERALEKYPDPAQIPERNIKFTQEMGLEYMKSLLVKAREM